MIFKEGRFFNSLHFTFKYILKNNTSSPRISFIVPKSVSKKAVERNQLRRLGYIVLEKYLKNLPQELAGVFMFKKKLSDVLIIENEIKDLLHKIN